MIIVVDNREQSPYTFDGYPVEVRAGTLATGDYSLAGFEADVAIERKELSDLIACLSHERDRFTRELERLRGFGSAALLIEAPFSAIAQGKYRSRMDAGAAVQSLLSIMQRYKLPLLFADNRATGERYVYDVLRHYLRHAEQKYKAVAEQLKARHRLESQAGE